MNAIIDKTILLLYCLPCLLLWKTDGTAVAALLACVAASTFIYALHSGVLQAILTTVYSVCCFFIPQLCLFLPLLAYDYLPYTEFAKSPFPLNIMAPCMGGMAVFTHFLSADGLLRMQAGVPEYVLIVYILMGSIFAAFIHFRTNSYAKLYSRYQKTRDDDTELQILLKERNRSLLEKQDYEIYAATLKERNRIAREIHDNVGHLLTRSILLVGALKTVCTVPSCQEPLDQLDTTLNQAMDSIRDSVHNLHDSSMDLKSSLENLIRDFTFCPVRLDYSMSFDIPREVKYSLISITKEALVNISRHSNATCAVIAAEENPGFYKFVVRDNGTAANALSVGELALSSGIGLSNIQNRVSALNGHFCINNRDGFQIYITIPRAKEMSK